VEFLIIFIVLSAINVVFATIKSIVTINGGKLTASLISGGYFAFYNIMMQYTVADFPMWQKCIITFVCNVIGVYLVKWGEEKARKDKLWKVEATVLGVYTDAMYAELNDVGLSNKYIPNIGKYTEFSIYCETQAESAKAKEILNKYNAKYFVSESKTL
jgi:hypothetical protein